METKAVTYLFNIFWVFVAFVSCYDTYLTIRYFEELHKNEQNPIARHILNMDHWDTASTFVSLKMGCTILVLRFATYLFLNNRKWGLTIIGGLALFQSWLLYYLT